MALISSPIAYPPSSSPAYPSETHKRKLQTEHQYPHKRWSLPRSTANKEAQISTPDSRFANLPNWTQGPFLDDDDEDALDGDIQVIHTAELPESEVNSKTHDAPVADHAALTGCVALQVKSSIGRSYQIQRKKAQEPVTYERVIAERSTTKAGRATKSFYGIDIHSLLDQVTNEKPKAMETTPILASEPSQPALSCDALQKGNMKRRNMLWTEKYRARKFIDLVGDDRTHREVLRWIKYWDPVVFPSLAKSKALKKTADNEEPKSHRKILMLTGPPGLGKTTLAHVCARQAGYDVLEINASDERTSNVVRGRIKDAVGTETVKITNASSKQGNASRAGKPVCVVIDEVDGVMTGSGASGEGGFMKALIDLVALDQKNSQVLTSASGNVVRTKRKGEKFRLMRPMILICNDAYHPSLRPLRTSGIAETIHVRKPPLDKVVARLKIIFDAEGLPCDSDAIRKLCEATWGVGNKKTGSGQASAEGDIRGCLVVGEWAASKLRRSAPSPARLTRKWVEDNMTQSLSQAGGGSRGLGRGGTKEAVERVFQEGAGITKSEHRSPSSEILTSNGIGVREAAKKTATDRLREIIETTGECDRILTDCFSAYASHPFQDDTFLTKPNSACDWLHFHDQVSSKVHMGQEWELGAYLPCSILALHHLFASPAKQSWSNQRKWEEEPGEPQSALSGPKAHYAASEALKQNLATLQSLQTSLSISLMRSFRSASDLSTDLLPNLLKMLTPDVQPVTVGGSGEQAGIVSVRKGREKEMITRAVGVMHAVGLTFERNRVDTGRLGSSNWIYRMEPPLDNFAAFETASHGEQTVHPTRYAIRQAMDQEYQRYVLQKSAEARQARYLAGSDGVDLLPFGVGSVKTEVLPKQSQQSTVVAKLDFFGRPLKEDPKAVQQVSAASDKARQGSRGSGEERKVWVSFHEGFSNAVRKPITLAELLKDL